MEVDNNCCKKIVSDTNISSIKSCQGACYSGKEIIKILWHSFEIFIFKKHEKLLFCCQVANTVFPVLH